MARKGDIAIQVSGSLNPILKDLDREVVAKHVAKAEVTALNRTARNLRTAITRNVSAALVVKKKAIRRRIRIKKAKKGRPIAWIRFLQTGINAYVLGARQVGPRGRARKGGGRRRGGGVRIGKREVIPGAFIAKGRTTGKMHVLKRKNRHRDSARIQYVQINPDGDRIARHTVHQLGGPMFLVEFERDLKRRLRKPSPYRNQKRR